MFFFLALSLLLTFSKMCLLILLLIQFFLKITLRLSVSVPFSIRRFGKREPWNFGAIVVILSVMALFRGSSARPPSRWVISLQNKTGDLPVSAGFLNMNLHWRQQTHKIACVSRYCVFVLPKEIKCMKAISLSLSLLQYFSNKTVAGVLIISSRNKSNFDADKCCFTICLFFTYR